MRWSLFLGLLVVGLLVGLLGCEKSDSAAGEIYAPRFIIDGSIEADDFPVVKITHNVPINAKIDSALLEQIIIRWAKVEVETDDDSEILTLVHDKALFPY